MELTDPTLIGAVAGAALLAAVAFRQLIGTVIHLNQQLQQTVKEWLESEEMRQELQEKVTELEFQVASLQNQLLAQQAEFEVLRQRLTERDELIEQLSTRLPEK